ncbi:MAG: double zinc ribbon domain-containing protein, partial [Planctomycetota bacterium]
MRPLGDALRRLGAGLLDAAVPQTCVSCGTWLPTGLGLACAACRAALAESLGRPMCTRCGRTLPAAAIHEADCARCGREAHWNV